VFGKLQLAHLGIFLQVTEKLAVDFLVELPQVA